MSTVIPIVDLYRPSNGTEGELFEAEWCAHCERDRAYREDPDKAADGCEILARALSYDIDEPEYPKEWRRIETLAPDGLPINDGECTAFVQSGHPVPLRDDRTLDLFPVTTPKSL